MKGVSKHRNENFTFSAHFSTMGRINFTKGYYSAEYFKSMLFFVFFVVVFFLGGMVVFVLRGRHGRDRMVVGF